MQLCPRRHVIGEIHQHYLRFYKAGSSPRTLEQMNPKVDFGCGKKGRKEGSLYFVVSRIALKVGDQPARKPTRTLQCNRGHSVFTNPSIQGARSALATRLTCKSVKLRNVKWYLKYVSFTIRLQSVTWNGRDKACVWTFFYGEESCSALICLANSLAVRLSRSLNLSLPSSKSTFSQHFHEKCIREEVRIGSTVYNHISSE